MSGFRDMRPGHGHLPSIDYLAAHAEAEAEEKNTRTGLLSAGQRTEAAQLMADSRRARTAADWLRNLADEIRKQGVG